LSTTILYRFLQLLNQTAFSLLDETQQASIATIQKKMLVNSSEQARKKVAELEEIIRVQEAVYNPCLEVRDKLKETQNMVLMLEEQLGRF
jgi:hypothetical protein